MIYQPEADDSPFLACAREAFAFLAQEGFIESVALPTLLVMSNGVVAVEIFHGRHSREIGVDLVLAGERYGLPEILVVRHVAEPMLLFTGYKISRTAISDALTMMAQLFREHAMPALADTPFLVDSLRAERDRRQTAYVAKMLCSRVRPAAREAFYRHDYPTAIRLYEQIEPYLTSAEKAKLDYARRQVMAC